MNVKTLPADDHSNGWSAIALPRQAKAALTQDRDADWLVIGAGFAGLAAARRLAENRPQDSVVVLEAGTVGNNASGRNSGFAIDVPHNVTGADLETGLRHRRISRAGIASLRQQVQAHGIACDWSEDGKYHCAASEKASVQALEEECRLLQAMDEPFRWLDRQALSAEVGTDFYHSGIYTPGTVLLNPAALVQGLAAALPANVDLYENAPVIRWESGPTLTAYTGRARVRARQLVLAVNGFAGQFGVFKHKIMPFVLFAGLTACMNEAQAGALAGRKSWGITPAIGAVSPTLRRTRDQRLLVRSGFVYAPSMRCSESMRQRMKAVQQRDLQARYPALAATLELEHFWMGWLSITRNGAPGFGQLAPNVYSAVGCGGVGVARQSAAGQAIADLACAQDSALVADMLAEGEPSRLPRRPILDMGIRMHLARERWRYRAEA